MPFPQTLRRVRLQQFLSQAELARRAGLHPLSVLRLEAGKTRPSTRTVRALAEALGVPPGDLATPDEVAEADKLVPRDRPGGLSSTSADDAPGILLRGD